MTNHKRRTRHPQAARATEILERNRLDEAPLRVTSSEHCPGGGSRLPVLHLTPLHLCPQLEIMPVSPRRVWEAGRAAGEALGMKDGDGYPPPRMKEVEISY